MNVDSILLAEFAKADENGRLTVVSAFNKLSGPGPQWGLPMLYISLVIHGHRDEAGKVYEGEIRLVNSDRELQLKEPLPIEVRFHEDDGSLDEGVPLRTILTAGIMGVAFTAPGPYAFEVYIDGIYHAATTLYVRQVAQTDGA